MQRERNYEHPSNNIQKMLRGGELNSSFLDPIQIGMEHISVDTDLILSKMGKKKSITWNI